MTQNIQSELPANRQTTMQPGSNSGNGVHAFAFFVITVCIVISVLTSVLAIWGFADNDVLWRALSTCFVVAAGCAIFASVHVVFGTTSR